jgi:hypothetical protein
LILPFRAKGREPFLPEAEKANPLGKTIALPYQLPSSAV